MKGRPTSSVDPASLSFVWSLPLSLLLRAAVAAAVLSACSSGADSSPARSPLSAPRAISGPQLEVSGARATALWTALEDALVEQHRPLAGAAGVYEVASLDCEHIMPPPPSAARHQCRLDYRVGTSGPFTSVTIEPPSTLAEPLLDALSGAGAGRRLGKYSIGVQLASARVTRHAASFEDRSKLRPPVAANVEVMAERGHATQFATIGEARSRSSRDS
jgi:hypothetical protein